MDHDQTPRAPAAQSQAVEDTAGSHPEHAQILTPGSGESNGAGGRDTRSQASSTYLINPTSEGHPTHSRSHDNPYADFERIPGAPSARSRDGNGRVSLPRKNLMSNGGFPVANQNVPGVDWIVPVEVKNDVSVVFVFWIRQRHTCTCVALGAPHRGRTPSTNDRQCCH